ncbi:MAG: HPr family phosphocarrier protein, partial [Thermoguttaceae bacterium]|nr:HPr family phosphocarrier protein [Thermoguttaceae bacterium]
MFHRPRHNSASLKRPLVQSSRFLRNYGTGCRQWSVREKRAVRRLQKQRGTAVSPRPKKGVSLPLFFVFSTEKQCLCGSCAVEVNTQLQVTKTVKITNKAGFHLRPMNQIVKVAETAQSDVTLVYKSCRADCKSSW